MDTLTVTAEEVSVGDIAFGMVVTDIGVKNGRPKLFGIGVIATSTREHDDKATTVDPSAQVTIQRPKFKYRPRSRF